MNSLKHTLHWETFNVQRLHYGPVKTEPSYDLEGCFKERAEHNNMMYT